ncbi:IS4 family transposase [Bacillus canaveralius]|uniref:IS4 family transposase n=1 Tax=Bacillus canaveralius TaxID=1403243 RepID=UPI000F78CFD5|nr:IS4 family transposase [Bacillus canaveralius]RSK42568.1 IS4 family transposase [Bacillus canaveralius]
MIKNTTFPNLVQKIILEDEMETIKKAIGYHDTARKLTIFHLVQYLVTAAANEWKSFRHSADVGENYDLPSVDHSTLSKKAASVDFQVFKQVFELVVSKCNRETRRALKIPKQLLIVDSTTITVGKTRLPWAVYHGQRSGVKLHVGFTPKTGMPLKVMESTGLVHDGPVGEKFADPRFILVEDRAYFKIKRIDQFVEDGQSFVIRMKDNIEIHRPHSLKRLVEEPSRVTKDITCQLGTPQSRSEKRHRVIFFKDDKKREIRVVTDLMKVSAEVIAEMYKTRWQIETFFRWIKQNLNVPVLFGTTENAVYNQLYAALIAFVLLKWLYDCSSKGSIFTKLSFISFQRKWFECALPIDWASEMALVISKYSTNNGIGLSNYG